MLEVVVYGWNLNDFEEAWFVNKTEERFESNWTILSSLAESFGLSVVEEGSCRPAWETMGVILYETGLENLKQEGFELFSISDETLIKAKELVLNFLAKADVNKIDSSEFEAIYQINPLFLEALRAKPLHIFSLLVTFDPDEIETS